MFLDFQIAADTIWNRSSSVEVVASADPAVFGCYLKWGFWQCCCCSGGVLMLRRWL
ncbi:hypothetical protein A2U01_0116846, partial [Trifolium medium]|nr:hypothetical protein [Trifolium medium]